MFNTKRRNRSARGALNVYHGLLGFTLVAMSMGCASRVSPNMPPALPRYVTVMLREAAIAPTKPDGRAWDCCGNVSRETSSDLSHALETIPNPFAQSVAIAALLAPLAGSGTIPPEVYGSAQLITNAMSQPRIAFNQPWQQDSYTPLFTDPSGYPPQWRHVPLDPGTHITGELWDKDLSKDDPIGPFDINYQALVVALQSNTIYPVKVSKTILFIRISVLAERP